MVLNIIARNPSATSIRKPKKKVNYLQVLEHRGHVKRHTHRRRVWGWGEREHASGILLLWGSGMRA